MLTKDNKKLKEQVYSKDEKLDLLFSFLINMQHVVLNRTSNMTVLQNLDSVSLRSKINEIQEEVPNLLYKKDKNSQGELQINNRPSSTLLSLNKNPYDAEEFDKNRYIN